MAAKSLNIKDPETHKLAQELAHATGQPMSKAVKEAIREQLNHVRHRNGRDNKEELLAIARRFRSKVKGPIIPHDRLLYDERGLPK